MLKIIIPENQAEKPPPPPVNVSGGMYRRISGFNTWFTLYNTIINNLVAVAINGTQRRNVYQLRTIEIRDD